jgi:hypothetical protein
MIISNIKILDSEYKKLVNKGKKLSLEVKHWNNTIYKFSKYNFFLNFFFLRLTFFSFLLQSKNFNFMFNHNFYYTRFKKNFLNFNLLPSTSLGWGFTDIYFFCEFRIIGLGLRFKRSFKNNLKAIKFDLGLGHFIYYFLPLQVKCIRRKKKFVIFSYDLLCLNNIIKHFEFFKPLNPYKIRGLKNVRKNVKIKIGKKQSQR